MPGKIDMTSGSMFAGCPYIIFVNMISQEHLRKNLYLDQKNELNPSRQILQISSLGPINKVMTSDDQRPAVKVIVTLRAF